MTRTIGGLMVLLLLALPGAARAEVPDGFLTTWLICGPFPNPPNKPAVDGKEPVYDHTPPAVGLDTDYLTEHGGESAIVPVAGMTHSKADGTQVTWFAHESPQDRVVFRQAVSREPNVVAYAYTTVTAPEAGAYLMALGSDEGVCVWLNGERVHYNLIDRRIQADDDLVPIRLRQGENRILVKVEQGNGGWGFIMRLSRAVSTLEPRTERLKMAVTITAPGELAGRAVSLATAGQVLATGVLGPATDERTSQVTLRIPFPPRGSEWGTLDVVLDGATIAHCQVPDTAPARADAYKWLSPQGDPANVFGGTQFPDMDFERPLWVEQLIGPYTISTRYYDADYQPVQTADAPGRYGAIVTVTPRDGEPKTHYVTLYRQPEDHVQWWRLEWTTFADSLPDGMGIDADVVRHQQGEIAGHLKWSFVRSLYDHRSGAVLLAGLHEMSPDDPPAVARTSVWARNDRWWTGLKNRLGLLEIPHLLYLPQDYDQDPAKRFPLVLFLHGSGERGDDLDAVKRHGLPKLVAAGQQFPFIIVSPQCPDGRGWQPTELGLLLDRVMADLRVDADRVYCTGLSMGGFGTWRLAQEYPDRFAAIAPICGGGDPRDVARIQDIPTWVFHGADDPAVPLSASQDMVDALKALGAAPMFTIYPDAGHDVWTETYANPELYTWLLQHTRSDRH